MQVAEEEPLVWDSQRFRQTSMRRGLQNPLNEVVDSLIDNNEACANCEPMNIESHHQKELWILFRLCIHCGKQNGCLWLSSVINLISWKKYFLLFKVEHGGRVARMGRFCVSFVASDELFEMYLFLAQQTLDYSFHYIMSIQWCDIFPLTSTNGQHQHPGAYGPFYSVVWFFGQG